MGKGDSNRVSEGDYARADYPRANPSTFPIPRLSVIRFGWFAWRLRTETALSGAFEAHDIHVLAACASACSRSASESWCWDLPSSSLPPSGCWIGYIESRGPRTASGRTICAAGYRRFKGNDEIAQLARTLNKMLDRIENSVNQLHTITNSLAHDLRSPMMAIRGKLELALLADHEVADRSAGFGAGRTGSSFRFLTKSLDVAEANADALHLRKVPVDLDELLRTMVDLYEPSLADRGLKCHVQRFARR